MADDLRHFFLLFVYLKKMNQPLIISANKIAVLRAGALRDFIVALPAIKAISILSNQKRIAAMLFLL